MAKQKFYVVWKGRKTGVFNNWDDCKKQVDKFLGAKYKSFKTRDQANNAYSDGYQKHWGLSKKFRPQLSSDQKKEIGFPIKKSIAVDGAWDTSTLKAEYQGVFTDSRELLFHQGPFEEGTNNIVEFLAIVHALSYCRKHSLTIPIYSDSKIAISWVRNKKSNTNLKKSDNNKKLFELIDRALNWLNQNEYENQILKWETKAWGENPADFGRK